MSKRTQQFYSPREAPMSFMNLWLICLNGGKYIKNGA